MPKPERPPCSDRMTQRVIYGCVRQLHATVAGQSPCRLGIGVRATRRNHHQAPGSCPVSTAGSDDRSDASTSCHDTRGRRVKSARRPACETTPHGGQPRVNRGPRPLASGITPPAPMTTDRVSTARRSAVSATPPGGSAGSPGTPRPAWNCAALPDRQRTPRPSAPSARAGCAPGPGFRQP